MCSHAYQPGSPGRAVYVRDGNVEALFKAAADVGDAVEIALWGSIGAPPDDSTDDLRDYLDSVYAPVVQRYCSPSP